MMADFVVPRHSAVMERLRRRIELFRRHNTSCENRYDNTARERLEMERQQTFALHQRCLQTKAKRSSKHRQPTSDQAVQRGSGTGGNNADLGDGGTSEQSRNSTLIALQESVKRKLESAGSPGQVNGFSDGYPPSKKACLDNGTSNGGIPPRSPLDSKHGIGADSLIPNGGEPGGTAAGEQEFRLKEMKQEPMDDILPCMLPSGGGASNSLFPDLNEQEWTELMEELNRSVAYEDIQDILNDGFEDRKDPPDLAGPTPGTGAQSGGTSQGGLLLPDLASVKAEFSPASTAFEQDSCAGSPHARPKSSGPPMQHSASFPAAATSTVSSPALPQPLSQQPPPSRQHPPQNHRLPPGPVSKDLSPAQQLQQLAAQQQRAQQMQSQLQQQQHAQKQQQQQAPKFHPPGSHPCRPSWPPQSAQSQSPLGGAYGLEKPTSPSLYPQDFPNNPKPQLMMPGQPNKGSPKAVAGGYLQPGGPHTNMLGHPAQGPGAPLSHPAAAGPGGLGSAMLNYSNTKPLSHYEAAAQGPPQGPPSAQSQNKAVLLSLLRQQQQMKQKQGLSFRPQLPHGQEQNAYPAAPHGPGPGNAMAPQLGGPGNGMAGNHGNVAYLSGQAAVKQQQLMEQQKQFLLGQRQQLIMAQQEKQRQQQEQQLQRHLTRPPPQYQDQQNQQPGAQNNPFQQQQVAQFTGSSQPLSNVGSLGGPAPGAQRMFPQTQQGMIGMTMGQQGGAGPTPGVPPPSSQADMSLASCVGVMDSALQHQVLYSNMNMHPSQQSSMQRQPVGNMGAPYRQNMLSQQQHLKNQPNATLLKQQQQQLARLPGSMPGGNMPSVMPNAMQSTQSQTWQQQGMQQAMGAQQPPSSNGGLPPNAFANPNAFHMQQQTHIPNKMPVGNTPFGANANGRPMGAMNPAQQQMMQQAQQRTAANTQVSLGQPLGPGQVLPNQQQQQGSQGQGVLPDLGAFGQPQGGRSVSQGLQCRQQDYQGNRTSNQQQQQQLPFGYNTGSGASSLPSFPGESDLVDSLLKERSTQEWMDDLDELLASHH
ncbi:mastermind-like protein 1 isoform X1 [Salmo salar]|uniref:Mastermind-like protein 1 isoform X1 n=2 Tax=Salmo salar TaxID=8030 RepID=A0A1S3RR59_SALSA|nr:mastermind-like protein 1 isoform X1 [Salmo salar]|eukprot:XP_014054815.1 PREDICTED: mastermind-like protein 1 isoform X1 [Salmo salar]